MLEASEILKEAKSIYDEADEATGPVQDTGYRSDWLEYPREGREVPEGVVNTVKKVLLTTTILAAMIAPAMADDDLVMKLPTGKIRQFKNGKATLHGSCRVPRADALVRRSNALVKGHPTCAQLFEASKLLQRASDTYDKDQNNHDISGEVRNIDRAASWTEDRAKAGKCRKTEDENEVDSNRVKWEKESRNLVPHPRKPVPAAEKLVRRANALLKGEPTCAAMSEASKLLERAVQKYIDALPAGDLDGDIRTTGRRAGWLEDLAKAGKCRKES